MALKFCANLNFLFTENGAGFLEKCRLARKAGFKGVECGFPGKITPEELTKIKNETGLEFVLLNISTGLSEGMQFGCAAFPNAREEFKKNLDMTVKVAKILKCNKIHVMAGKCQEKPNELNFQTYVDNLKIAAKIFEDEAFIGLIEPINKYAVPGYFLNNYETAVDVLNQVGSPNLKLMADIFHLQHIRGDITFSLKDLICHIGHIQIAQVPNRNEPNEPGELNFAYIFKAIEDAGYAGWIGCEYKPKKDTAGRLDWIKQFGYSL